MACECELQNTLDVEVTQDALLDVEIVDSAGVLLQRKSVEVTENGTSVVAPDDGFDGLSGVEINTNVPKRFECGDGYFLPITSAQKNLTLISRLQKVDVSCWDISSYTNMNNMFSGCNSLQQLDVSGWDTSKVTSMGFLFAGCYSLQQLDVSGWDTSKVTNMAHTFNSLQSVKSLDVSRWNTSKVTTMSIMFGACYSLEKLDISGWDTSEVTSMNRMFESCYSLEKLDISGWDTSKVTITSRMFESCNSLRSLIGDNTIQDVENGLKTMIGLKLSIQTDYSPLRFSSILALANGLADLTGGTAQTLTISKQSYTNMYNDDDTTPTADVIAERQARIAAICAAKNWNFAH